VTLKNKKGTAWVPLYLNKQGKDKEKEEEKRNMKKSIPAYTTHFIKIKPESRSHTCSNYQSSKNSCWKPSWF